MNNAIKYLVLPCLGLMVSPFLLAIGGMFGYDTAGELFAYIVIPLAILNGVLYKPIERTTPKKKDAIKN